ncbi:MAG: glycoside hydrolase family 25 protein, partial [Lachnospiraceae bacterium]|nr:glycoside hydrolase family 25 protein [Lachnospiraceae bacterium]
RREEEERLAAEAARQAEEEERRQREEEERLAAEAARQAEEEERRRREEEERLAAEAARQAEEEERRRREEEERLAAEAAEAERLRLEAEAEEARKLEEEARRIAAQNAADAERAAEVAEAKAREEEANLQAAKLAQERAEAEAATLKAEAEAEAAKAAKAEDLARQAKANKEANKASKKAAKKRKKYRVYREFSVGKTIAWVIAGLAAVVLLYLFAIPISKGFFIGKDAVDTFLADKFPKVAETIKVRGNGDAMPVFKDAGGTEYFIANADSFVMNHVWPQGYQASVVRLNGKQYICIEGKDLKVYYLNEVAENESKHVYLEKGDRKALYFWEYTFENPETLCPVNGVFNTSGVEQYAFYTNAGSNNVHILDASTLAECKVILPEKAILRVLNVEEYLEEEQTVRINMKIEDVPYSFAVPKKTGALVPDGYAIGLDGVVCTVNETGVRFEAYVRSAGGYLGKLIGEMEYTNQVYLVNQLEFFAYADEEYGDMSVNPVLMATTPEEAKRERVEVLGDRGERLLVPVRDDVKRFEYDENAFLTEKNGEISYIRDGKTVSVKGIDVSASQGSIDWEKVAASGVEYAMIRLGMRGDEPDGKCRVDANYGRNVKGALSAGVEVGVYFTSRATTVDEAKEEAQFVLKNMKEYDITWPVVLDTVENIGEETRASAVSGKDRTACAKAFMDEIAVAGYTPVLYTDARWSVLKLDMGELGDYDLWYTSNGELTDYPYHYTMWQYSNEGEVPGIDGNGNTNISFVDYGEVKNQEQ